jgi:hypothetical protein
MKKLFSLICLVLFLSAGTTVAQKQLYFGAVGTGLSTWVTNQPNYGRPDMDYVATFGGGGNITIGYDFSKNIGLQLQFGYAKLGQKFKDTQVKNDTTYQYTRNIKLNYLQLPLLFKYRSNGEVVRFYVLAGPQFDFLLSANQTYYKNDVKIGDEYQNPNTSEWVKLGEEDITSYYTTYDIFARADFGVDITVAKNLFINTGISFAYGLTDINATDWRINNSSGSYSASHNIAIGFNVGINYCLDFSKGK